VFSVLSQKFAWSSCYSLPVLFGLRLYTNPNLKPKYNLVFVLSGGGKFNYMGTKGLLEDLESSEAASLLSSADYTLCLDSLSMADADHLYVHVSKPPKEGAKGHLLMQYLNQVCVWCVCVCVCMRACVRVWTSPLMERLVCAFGVVSGL